LRKNATPGKNGLIIHPKDKRPVRGAFKAYLSQLVFKAICGLKKWLWFGIQ